MSHVGSLILTPFLTLSNVLCVSSFAYNFLSFSKLLLQDSSYEVSFLAAKCYLQNHNWKQTVELGKEEGGLYMLTSDPHSTALSFKSTGMASTVVSDVFVANVYSSDVWHARLGHASAKVVQMLPVTCDKKVLDVCDSCYLAKQTRLSFPLSTSTSAQLFDLVHADLWGPYRFKTHGTCTMFLTLVEDKSRTTWIYLVADKSSVSQLIQEFVTLIRNQYHVVVKTFRTDNGTEFMNHSLTNFFASLGILHQSSCAYTPQQNGLVERKHRHLLNCARALRFHANLPLVFWGDCLLTAAYLINRTPSPSLNNKSPYEILHDCVPDYSDLRIFGCLCYAAVLPHSSDKFAARSVKGVFIGYPYGKKGYKVLDLNTRKIFVSRDVQFVETIFPFKDIDVTPPQHLFPDSSVFVEDEPLQFPLVLDNTDSALSAEITEPSSATDSLITDVLPPINEAPVLRPSRQRHLPAKFLDYTGLPPTLCGSISANQISNMQMATVSSSVDSTSHSIILVDEPQHYKQAVDIPEWCTAMNVELAALEANHT